MERTFDYRFRWDERNALFPVAALAPEERTLRSYTWGLAERLDQGSEGACTGFAMAHELAALPGALPAPEWLARALYYRARQLDQWPGEDYEGSSILGVVKAAMEIGFAREYRWAWDEEDLAWAVGHVGPAVIGVRWYEGMREPNAHGLVAPSGEVIGGHAVLVRGVSLSDGVYRITNSWGPDWGQGGECFLLRRDMARLIASQAEVCVPLNRRRLR